MHRVFFTFHDASKENTPVFIMWGSVNGKSTEKDFILNNFTVLLPFNTDLTDHASDDSLKIGNLLDKVFTNVCD